MGAADPSSTTTSSQSLYDCPTTESIAWRTRLRRSKVGTITETLAGLTICQGAAKVDDPHRAATFAIS